MLGITRQADYALRAALEVSRLSADERVPTSVIAERQDVPLPFLTKIVSQLVMRGIFAATRGAKGGISLARAADEITLLALVEAIDGPVRMNCCTQNPETCDRSDHCSVCEVLSEAESLLIAKLESVTLAQLRERADQLAEKVP